MADDAAHTFPNPKQMAIPLPHRFKLEQDEGGLKVTAPTRSRPLGATLFFLAWTGLALFLFQRSFWNGFYFEAFVLLGIFGIGLALLLSLLPAYLNTTEVTIKAGQLQIKQGPFRPKYSRFEAAKIKQLYVKETYHITRFSKNTGNIYHYSYNLHLVALNGDHLQVLAGLTSSNQALYLEQEIERYLGLADREALYEPVADGRVDKEERDKQSSWQELAKRHHLTFTSRSALKGNYVSGQYRDHYLELDNLIKNQAEETETSTRLLVLARPEQTLNSRSETSILEEVKALLERPAPSFPLEGLIQFDREGQAVRYEQSGPETRVEVLQFLFDALVDLIKLYPKVVALGGKVVSLLQEKLANDKRPFYRPIQQLLAAIAEETTTRLAAQAPSLRCADCLGFCVAHPLPVASLGKLTYYGCQSCFQSQNFIQLEGQVIAVLDNHLETDRTWQGDHLQINWLARIKPFSFDAVEIVRASDEEVERFVVQVGNDTDPFRQPRYRSLPCWVSAACPLSQNTFRVLEQAFDRVEIIS